MYNNVKVHFLFCTTSCSTNYFKKRTVLMCYTNVSSLIVAFLQQIEGFVVSLNVFKIRVETFGNLQNTFKGSHKVFNSQKPGAFLLSALMSFIKCFFFFDNCNFRQNNLWKRQEVIWNTRRFASSFWCVVFVLFLQLNFWHRFGFISQTAVVTHLFVSFFVVVVFAPFSL